ncbi:MAG: deoxyribose-phosphate aldolase [Acidilobaceae archaeon]|nr:deoxyribose-phosphate aldolase [Acidilobaceae archaeon]
MKLEPLLRLFVSERELASIIESTLLDPRAARRAYEELVKEAAALGFRCALVSPAALPYASPLAQELGVRLCSVVGFPSGLHSTRLKLAEAEEALAAGATSIDLVPNFSLLSGALEELEAEICAVSQLAKGVELKVIVEAPLLSQEELEHLAMAAARCRASYLKTSTGVYSKGGDAETVLRTYRVASRHGLGVKAAGGIRGFPEAALAFLAGASIIGSSSAGRILSDYLSLKRGEGEGSLHG